MTSQYKSSHSVRVQPALKYLDMLDQILDRTPPSNTIPLSGNKAFEAAKDLRFEWRFYSKTKPFPYKPTPVKYLLQELRIHLT